MTRLAAHAAFTLLLMGKAFALVSNCPPAPGSIFATNGERLDFGLGGAKPLRILAIGSSSTQGIGATKPEFTYPSQLGVMLRALWRANVEVFNAGVAGETGPATLKRLESAVATQPEDLLIWQVGTNDAIGGGGPAQFRAVVDEGLKAAAAARVPVILIDPQYFPGIKDVSRYEQFVRVIAEEAQIWRASVFSRYAMMKSWGAKSENDLVGMLSPDRFHMDDKGYACLAQALAADIVGSATPKSVMAVSGAEGPKPAKP